MIKKSTYGLIALVMGFSLLSPAYTVVEAEDSKPVIENPVSVRLNYAALKKTSLSFTLNGSYGISDNSNVLTSGRTYGVSISGSKITLKEGDKIIASDNELEIYPIKYNNQNSVKLGSYDFLGYMKFKIYQGYILPINKLGHEEYLMGVVAAEMSDNWGSKGIEALKAQTITARTYSQEDIGKEIDNGQGYQVYNGYNSNYSNVIKAVRETSGQIISYNGVPIGKNAVFSSSNGGVRISKVNSWGDASWNKVPYLNRIDDPYDSRSGSSNSNWSFKINKQQISLLNKDMKDPGSWWSSVNEYNYNEMNALKGFIRRYDTNLSNYDIKIVSINTLDFTDLTDKPTTNTPLTGQINLSYIAYDKNKAAFLTNSDGTIKINSFSKSTRTYDYYMYNAFGNTLLKGPNVKSVASSGTDITVTGGGWGHGIGMSQWGAYQRAIEGQTAEQIIQFYYPGTSLNKAAYVEGEFEDVPNDNPINTEVFGLIKGTSVNLRKTDSWGGEKVTNSDGTNVVIKVGEEVGIIKEYADWYQVNYQGNVGFVAKSYVTIKEKDQSTPTPTPTPPPEEDSEQATVGVKIKSVENTSSTFNGTYEISEESMVQILLEGPNNLKKLTFMETLKAGNHTLGGPLNGLPNGVYKVTVKVTKDNTTATDSKEFILKNDLKASIKDVNIVGDTFNGEYEINEAAKVNLVIKGNGISKFFYSKNVEKGKYEFGGPLGKELRNGTYQIKLTASGEDGEASVYTEILIKRGQEPKITMNDVSFKSNVFLGTYKVDQDSHISVLLKGPNNLTRLITYENKSKGTYNYGGNIATFPDGQYSVLITAQNTSGVSVSKNVQFEKKDKTVSSSSNYSVKSGDTLWSISRLKGISVEKIMELNSLKTTSLKIGQLLKI